jgi:hypothetical protein
MTTPSEIQYSAARLVTVAEQHGTDMVITVSTDAYRIMFIPKGKEGAARMELNERLGHL